MDYKEIKTYPEMNKTVKELLLWNGDNYCLYALKRIEELEAEAEVITLTRKENQLAVHYLNEYSSELGNNTCNDVDDRIYAGWTKEERQQFIKEYHEYNCDPEEYDPNLLHLPDFAIVGFIAHKLSKNKQKIMTYENI